MIEYFNIVMKKQILWIFSINVYIVHLHFSRVMFQFMGNLERTHI